MISPLRAIFDAAGCLLATSLSTWSHSCFAETPGLLMATRNLGLPFPVSAATLRSFAQSPERHVPQPARALSPEEFWNVVSLILEREHLPSSICDFCGFSLYPLQPYCQDRPPREHERHNLCLLFEGRQGNRPPYSWAVPRPTFLGLLLFIFCWMLGEQVFWWQLTLRDTVTLRLDGGGPVRCCTANGCGSFVMCSLISEDPWTHERSTPSTP